MSPVPELAVRLKVHDRPLPTAPLRPGQLDEDVVLRAPPGRTEGRQHAHTEALDIGLPVARQARCPVDRAGGRSAARGPSAAGRSRPLPGGCGRCGPVSAGTSPRAWARSSLGVGRPAPRRPAPQAGGGRKRVVHLNPAVREALLALVEPDVRGDPMSRRWTTESTPRLAEQLPPPTATGSPRTRWATCCARRASACRATPGPSPSRRRQERASRAAR